MLQISKYMLQNVWISVKKSMPVDSVLGIKKQCLLNGCLLNHKKWNILG